MEDEQASYAHSYQEQDYNFNNDYYDENSESMTYESTTFCASDNHQVSYHTETTFRPNATQFA